MKAGYLIAHLEVTDAEAFALYRARIAACVEAAGGEYLVHGGAADPVEGEMPGPRTVVIRFPSLAAAQDWYRGEDYAPLLALRLASARGAMTLVEGV